MKNFVVGCLNAFDNVIVLEKIQAETAVEAMKKHTMLEGYEFEDIASVEDIQKEAFNWDMSISAIEI